MLSGVIAHARATHSDNEKPDSAHCEADLSQEEIFDARRRGSSSSASAAAGKEQEERERSYIQAQAITTAYMTEWKKTTMGQPPLRCLIRQPLAPSLAGGHCGLDCSGARALSAILPRMVWLERISLADNRLADQGCVLLCAALEQLSTRVRALDLDNNFIRLNGAQRLSQLVKRGTLEELALSGNRLGDEAVAAVAMALQAPGCALRWLDVSANEAAELTCQALAASLSGSLSNTPCPLQHLNISWNKCRGLSAARLALSFGQSALTWLDASWNGFGGMESETNDVARQDDASVADFIDSGTMRVQKNPGSGASTSMLHMSGWLMTTKTLHFLNLSYNRISTEGSVVLAVGLEKCLCLETFRLDGNPIYRAGARALWTASAKSSDKFQIRRLLSLSACGISNGMSSFDVTEPAGKYALDMGLIYAQTILHSLMKIASRGDGVLVDVRLGGKTLKLNPIATSRSEEEWQIPSSGTVCARFQYLKEAHLHHIPPSVVEITGIAQETILDVLNGELRAEDQNVFLTAAFAGRIVGFAQVEHIM